MTRLYRQPPRSDSWIKLSGITWTRGVDCECDVSCRDHPSGGQCILNGRPHVHPGDAQGRYGLCPVHPEAIRSPLFNLINAG